MEGILLYIAKACLAGTVMVLFFRLMFRKGNLFQFNRLYLLTAILVPFAIPLVTLKVHAGQEVMPAQTDALLATLYAASGSDKVEVVRHSYPLLSVLFFLYAGGAAVFLLQLLLSFIRIRSMIRTCTRQDLSGQKVYVTQKDIMPFSFLNKIVISEKAKRHPRLKLMLEHEKMHVTQWHTFDILVAEIYRALLWFSPFAWMLARDLKTNLEFIADEGVTGNGRDLEAYQATLVSLAAGFTPIPLTNGFNYTQLKKRIVMMTKTMQPRKFTWKYMLVIPLMTALLFTFCSKEAIYDLGTDELTVTGTVTDASGSNPISGVNVVVNGTNTGVVTNENGSYRITLTRPDDTLQFSSEFGQVVSVLPAGRNKVDVSMDTGSGIRVRGFASMSGVQPLYYVDGIRVDEEALQKVDPNEIESVQVLKDSDSAVEYAGTEEARERGVVIIVTKGASSEIKDASPEIVVRGYGPPEEAETGVQNEAGEQETVRVRGYSTATGVEPIYVIDDIPYTNGLPELDPNDILSVEVLKDASAYAFLGTEEGRQRGVVAITTKRFSQEVVVTGYGSPGSGSISAPEFFNRLNNGADNGTDPIIMLDGAVYEGDMDTIDPNTIESILVLKGDEAFETFGTEEARQKGVIVVTSKKAE